MKKPSQKLNTSGYTRRIWYSFAVICLVFALILGNSFVLQILEYDKFSAHATSQNSKLNSIEVLRGKILDSKGGIIAASVPTYSVFLFKSDYRKTTAEERAKLARVLSLSAEDMQRIQDSSSNFIWVKKYISQDEFDQLSQSKLSFVQRTRDFKRVYPLGRFSPQVVGFSGAESKGLEGIEYRYDNHLMDRVPHKNALTALRAQGGDIVLTLDTQIQSLVDRSLKRAVRSMEAISGIAIVMESKTGAILAMSSVPDYDPNNFRRYTRKDFYNHATGSTYEPGSTFKTITLAIARQSGAVQADSSFFCENGQYQVLDHTIRDTTGKFGMLTLEQIIQKSSNICAIKIAQQIPAQKFYEGILNFGFGKKTNIGLPEATGQVHRYQSWSASDRATISYGHSIAVTPIQMLSAINVFANGGQYAPPFIIKQKLTAEGTALPVERRRPRRVIQPEIAAEIGQYMEAVITKEGTGRLGAIAGVRVAGKTGTTQKFDRVQRRYSNENHIVSFAGFLPVEDPKLTIITIINQPKKRYKNSKTAVPVFREIAMKAIHAYDNQRLSFDHISLSDARPQLQRVLFAPESITEGEIPKRIHKKMFLRQALNSAAFYRQDLSLTGSGQVYAVENTPDGQAKLGLK